MIDFDKEFTLARQRVATMDVMDGGPDREPKTILAALDAGLRTDLGAAFDALAMLTDVVDHDLWVRGQKKL